MFAFTAKKIKNALAFGLIAFGTTLISSTSLSAFAATTPKECKILVMGDSLSAAYGLAKEQGWVALMEGRLKEKFPHCNVVNASVSGETTAGGKTRLPALLKQHQPTHMILELGANDALRGLSLNTMKNNLNNMLQAASRTKTKSLLVGMQIPSNYGPSYTRKFGGTFAEVAKEQKVPLVPFMMEGFALDPNAFLSDGIHPNASAQPKVLENIWPALSATLK